MSRLSEPPRPASRLPKETSEMSRRFLIALAAVVGALALSLASPLWASAASPWWQILDGSRPSNLWEPTDNVQEIKTAKANVGGEEVLIAEVKVGSEAVGCMAAGNFAPAGGAPASFICAVVLGLTPIESAADLEAALEGPYGAGEVEVSGGPAGGEPFIVTVSGRSVPSVQVSPLQPGEGAPFLGSASTTVLSVGGSGRLVVTVTNLGNEAVDASGEPVTIVDRLPDGVIASGAEAFAGAQDDNGPLECEVEASGTKVSCTFEGEELPAYESIEIEILVSLTGEPPATEGTITVSGGGVKEKSASQVINVSPEKVSFGIERFSAVAEENGGAESTLAGKHPFQFTTTLQFNAGQFQPGPNRLKSSVEQPAQPRNFRFTLPAGLTGNTRSLPQCSLADFNDGSRILTNQCPDETAVGIAATTIVEKSVVGFTRLAVPLFNLTPSAGEPLRLGLTAGGASVVIDTEVDPDDEYRVIATVRNATQLAQILSTTVTIWGTPGDPAHDAQRGWVCGYHLGEPLGTCEDPPGANEDAFLRLPVNCSMPSVNGAEVEPWNVPLRSVVASEPFSTPPLEGCAQVPFQPSISAAPTNKHAGGPSGLDVELNMPNKGLLGKDEIAEGQAKKVEVTLPEGVTINPSQAEGLAACSLTQFGQETASSPPGAGCPEAAKVGSVQVKTPILEEEAKGSVYVAKPFDNPFGSLVALYVVAKIPQRGIVVKQAGKVELNPRTGQLVTTFDGLPQLPFGTFKLHFNEGNRAPLVMPQQCGTYDMVTKFTPWSAEDPDNPTPSEVVTKTSPFSIDQGCPSGAPGFSPDFVAGTTNNSAGGYSPFNIRLTRDDDEQEFSRFSVKLPKGVIGKLAGIPFCSDAAIAAARTRTGPNGGQEELDSPSCPSAAQIGRTLVGAGVGPELTYVPGKVYLAGPYQRAKLSIVAITAGKAGPFDLGTVVIRQALRINSETAEVTSDGSSSDPIPHILKGVVVHARDIRVFIDKKDFVLNPTNCERMSAAATVLSSGGQTANVTSPFQAADCASLGLKPKLSIQLLGGTKRTATPRLKAVLTARKGDANIGRAQVTLPKSEFLEQAHIRTVCTRVQFNAGGGNGEQCPKGSIYGKAKATSPLLDETLSGPVFLRSSNHELPDLVAALHSSKVDINLLGRIDSVGGGIRSTFEGVPDAPVTKFTLEMQGGQKGLIVNSTNICKGKHHATAKLTGQNGRLYEFNPVVKAKCGGKKGGKGGKGK
jgi:hypothetical protein